MTLLKTLQPSVARSGAPYMFEHHMQDQRVRERLSEESGFESSTVDSVQKEREKRVFK